MQEIVRITKFSNIFIKVLAEPHIRMGLSDAFARYVKGYRFQPKFRSGVWDGKIRFFKYNSGLIYAGLLLQLLEYLKVSGIKFQVDEDVLDLFRNIDTKEQIAEYLDNLNLTAHGAPIQLRDYQRKAVELCIRKKRKLIQSPTSSGKSSIIYSVTRYLLDNTLEDNEDILIVVPTINLITQMKNDFKDYSTANKWEVDEYVGLIGGGNRDEKKRVIISTWQSIYKKPKEWFDRFRVLIIDEVHQSKAPSLVGIGEKCNAEFRFGLSGSIDSDDETTEMTITGLFGTKYVAITTKDLMERGEVSKLTIHTVVFDHGNQKIPKDYATEIQWICDNEPRNNYIVELAHGLEGNVLILFSLVEKHGKPLLKKLKDFEGKEVFFVYGGTDAQTREEIRGIAENHKGCIILASYQTFSTGVNIRNLHNIIFASPTKSYTRVIQSIGRGLRKSNSKDHCHVFDLVDLIYGNYKRPKSTNYTFQHFSERMKIYIKESFNCDLTKVKLE